MSCGATSIISEKLIGSPLQLTVFGILLPQREKRKLDIRNRIGRLGEGLDFS